MFDPISLSAIEGLYDVVNGLRAGFTNGMKIYNTAGAFNFTVPANVSKIKAIVIGGGGGGGMGRLPIGADVSAYKTYLATKFFNGEDGLSSSFSSITAAGGPGGKQNGVNVGVNGGASSLLCNGGSLLGTSTNLSKLDFLVEPNGVILKTKLGVCDVIPNATQTGTYNMTFNNAAVFNGTLRQDIGPLYTSIPLVSGEMVSGCRGDGFGAGGAGGACVVLNALIDHSTRVDAGGTTVNYALQSSNALTQLPEMKYASSVPFNLSADATDPLAGFAGDLTYTKKSTMRLIGSGGGSGEVKTGILDVSAGATISGSVGLGGKGGKYLKFNSLYSQSTAPYYHTKFIEILGQTAGANVVGIDTMLTTWRSSASVSGDFVSETDWWNGIKVFETAIGTDTPNIGTATSAVAFNKPMTLTESVGRDGVVIIMW